MKTFKTVLENLPMTFTLRPPADTANPCEGCALITSDGHCAVPGPVGCWFDILIAADEDTERNATLLKIRSRLQA